MGRVAARLREAKFLVSPKSTLEPTDSLQCLGKLSDLDGGGGSSPIRSSLCRSWFWHG